MKPKISKEVKDKYIKEIEDDIWIGQTVNEWATIQITTTSGTYESSGISAEGAVKLITWLARYLKRIK